MKTIKMSLFNPTKSFIKILWPHAYKHCRMNDIFNFHYMNQI